MCCGASPTASSGAKWHHEGSAARQASAPGPHSRFRIGSITKTFVATVVLQLVEEGRVALDRMRETVPMGMGSTTASACSVSNHRVAPTAVNCSVTSPTRSDRPTAAR
ncbi:serine hydrolase [Nocardia sp. XZ_19_231]|uniref:serine hydrolase n=1 Tax=Nocardia sp. XZ_19_231 TaxID=2769252 RepID=UPI00351C55D3